MKIIMRPMTPEESWEHIMDNYNMYHKKLKHFGYRYNSFIPGTDFIKQMFEQENLTPEYIHQCKEKFINNVYDEKALHHLDDIFNNGVKQKFEQVVNECLVPLLPSWNTVMPKTLELRCTFGQGSGYWRLDDDTMVMLFRMSRFPDDATALLNIMFHEFVHMLIEKSIIQKYHVPQDLKERIVDLICYEFVKKPVQPMFEKSFANGYINLDVIKNDLPGAVAKMMADYAVLHENPKQM